MDFRRGLAICTPYLGPVVGRYSDWTPLSERQRLFPEDLDESDPWQPGERTQVLTSATEGMSRCCAGGVDEHTNALGFTFTKSKPKALPCSSTTSRKPDPSAPSAPEVGVLDGQYRIAPRLLT